MDVDPVDLMKPWTVKSVPTRVANEITAAARRDGLTTGQLLEQMWDAWQRGGGAKPPASDVSGLDQVERAITAAVTLAAATNIPPGFRRRAEKALNRLMREALPDARATNSGQQPLLASSGAAAKEAA